jgi:UDP-3-O-[3-hydroxymyristoyl] glucosamine N-acyltransferase
VDGDVAIAVSPDTIRVLGESRAKIALVPEGTQFPHQRFQTVILMRGSRSSLPEITHVFRHRPDVQPGVHPSAVVAPDAVIGEGATIGPLVVIGPGASVGPRSIILSQATLAAGATLGADCLVYSGVRIGWGCCVAAQPAGFQSSAGGLSWATQNWPERIEANARSESLVFMVGGVLSDALSELWLSFG